MATAPVHRRKKPAKVSAWLSAGVAYGVLAVGAFIMLLPFYYMMVFATRANTEILSVPPPYWFGSHLFENIDELIRFRPGFWRSMLLSFWVALATTALNLFFCSLAGFAFAMYEFKHKEKFFGFVMATMLMPAFVGMIPTILLMTRLGWIDSVKALIIPGACGALGVFMMRQYVSSALPKELIEAGRMDGCGEFGLYWRIALPLLGPAMGTLGLITFIGSYNNFVGALLVMRDQASFTVPLVLRSLQGTSAATWGAISVGSAIAVMPLLVLFVVYSRRLIDGLTAGAVKG
jgi:multiple sugar transport system permease protein